MRTFGFILLLDRRTQKVLKVFCVFECILNLKLWHFLHRGCHEAGNFCSHGLICAQIMFSYYGLITIIMFLWSNFNRKIQIGCRIIFWCREPVLCSFVDFTFCQVSVITTMFVKYQYLIKILTISLFFRSCHCLQATTSKAVELQDAVSKAVALQDVVVNKAVFLRDSGTQTPWVMQDWDEFNNKIYKMRIKFVKFCFQRANFGSKLG